MAGKRERMILAAALSLLLLAFLLGGVAYWLDNRAALGRRLEDALAKGNLLTPPGDNAFELYHQLKREGANAKTLEQIHQKLLPVIAARPQKILADFAVPTNAEPSLAEWQEAHKLMEWASQIKPEDKGLTAKSSYCAGRIAYLTNRKEEALELWKRAGEEDASWAIPLNSVGLIYNERRDYPAARQYLLEAIRRDPNWALPYNNIGTAFFYEQDFDQAESYYLQAVERAPQWARPHAWLGDIAMRRKDYDRAIQEYEAVLNLSQSGNASLDLEKIRQQLDRARQLLSQQAPTC